MTSTCKLKALFSGEYSDKAGPDVDKISVHVIVHNQSCDHCPSNFDNPEEGNSTHNDSENLQETSDISTQNLTGNSMNSCPAIFDFKTCRDVNRFKVGQIWALYDKHDAMPRQYAKIMHFDAHNHKIHLNWLEHDATNKEEEKWTDKKLPVACGSFRLQPTVDASQNRFMFSHIVAWTKGTKGNSYDIYPNKGEVWALYKGWSMQWRSDTDSHRWCEYELVEVLSNMSSNDGATVIPLVKIKDSVSLFARAKGMSSFFIPSSELLRFSHSISFYRTNGNEKVGVPRGFLELDTACLPVDLDAAFSSVPLVSYLFLGNMTGCVLGNFTTESAANNMDYGDEPITQKEKPLLEQNVCHSISTDDTGGISYEQNTSGQKKAHDANELVREDTSTVPNAAGSCDLQMLGKRKHDDCVDSDHRRDSCINKRQSKNNFPSDANSTADKMYAADVAVASTQAAKHVPDTMDNQGEGNATRCFNKRRSKDNLLSDANSTAYKMYNDDVAVAKTQAAKHVPDTMESQGEGNATREDCQEKYKEEATCLKKVANSNIYTYPDSDFHKFQESRSCEKFERGQVWAMYNDFDKLPKFYAWIRKVREKPFRVEVIWLEACPKQDQEKQWLAQDIPISCGTFIIRKWTAKYDTRDAFSHRVYCRETGKKRELEILPRVGNIWAVYMNWAPDWVPCSVDDCEFAICEVVECTEASTKLTFLAQVRGYRSVFKPDKQRGVLVIPAGENLRFSHQIPYFRLTEEGGGSLCGFYELDPSSVPDDFMHGDT